MRYSIDVLHLLGASKRLDGNDRNDEEVDKGNSASKPIIAAFPSGESKVVGIRNENIGMSSNATRVIHDWATSSKEIDGSEVTEVICI